MNLYEFDAQAKEELQSFLQSLGSLSHQDLTSHHAPTVEESLTKLEHLIFPSFWLENAPKEHFLTTTSTSSPPLTNHVFYILPDSSDLVESVKDNVRETSKKNKKQVEEVKEEVDTPKKNSFRWTLAPKEQKILTIKFNTNEVGKHTKVLKFNISGTRQVFSATCNGTYYGYLHNLL
ncbi:hypothetical protein HMI54_011247 [Coelomomyces lativittatus]|nr:hypothetical protein HMI54_011247 [Coelomomyces lativittatus]